VIAALDRARLVVSYWLSWAFFIAVGLLLNLGCAPFLLLPRRPARERAVRRVMRRLFTLWVNWHGACGVINVRFVGFDRPLSPRTVFIANHPTIVDATFLLSRLPDTICIFKPALMRHPAIGPAAIMGGYASGDTGIDLVRDVTARVKTGQSLLVFPEGTRTEPGTVLGPLKPGFALIACRARAAVQLVVVRSSPGLGRRGIPWWRPPSPIPAWIEFTLDQRWEPGAAVTPSGLTAAVDARLRSVLGTTVA
jgi:1-acyl-sn-glycerol-3-phosphate acyltransferase